MLTGIHKDLAQIAEEQFKATSALFGKNAFERVRKHHDVLSWQKYYTACSESWCPKDKQLWACKIKVTPNSSGSKHGQQKSQDSVP